MSKGMLIWQAVMAGLQVLAGLATLGDLIGAKPAATVVVVVAALQASTAALVRGIYTPVPDQPKR